MNYEKSANLLSPTNISILHTRGMKDSTLVDSKYWPILQNIMFITLDPIIKDELAPEFVKGAFI